MSFFLTMYKNIIRQTLLVVSIHNLCILGSGGMIVIIVVLYILVE